MLFSKFSWNWHSGSGKENFQNCQYIYAILISSPLGKKRSPLFEQIWIPVTQGCVVISLVEICSVVLEKMKMWNIYRQTNGKTDDDRQQGIIKAHLRLTKHKNLWSGNMPENHFTNSTSIQLLHDNILPVWLLIRRVSFSCTYDKDAILNISRLYIKVLASLEDARLLR